MDDPSLRYPKPRALLICGSHNQTTQMHQIAKQLPDFDCSFSPYYSDHWAMHVGRWLRLQDWCIMGYPARRRCIAYLEEHDLDVDVHGKRHDYDLVITSSDLVIPPNILGKPIVAVQEGILDQPNWMTRLCKRFRWLPRWWGGTAMTGQSGLYDLFCVASEGYRQHFISEGADADKVRVTGIPNFDDCERYYNNEFPYRDYVLVCTSDCRETFKPDDRPAFIQRAVDIADGRQLIFKLHPNEKVERATREVAELAPDALVFAHGSAEEMVANSEVVICQWTSLAFVGMALGKEVHSFFPQDELEALLPVQNRSAATNIARAARQLAYRRLAARAGAPKALPEAA